MKEQVTIYDDHTRSGIRFNVANFKRSAVNLKDIAATLSMQVRYGGRIKFFYSVAHHSMLICDKLASEGEPPHVCLYGLMHDAHEAYLVDVPAPLLEIVPVIKTLSVDIQNEINAFLGLELSSEEVAKVHMYDKRIRMDEKAALIPESVIWTEILEPLGVKIRPSRPNEDVNNFLKMAMGLWEKTIGSHNAA